MSKQKQSCSKVRPLQLASQCNTVAVNLQTSSETPLFKLCKLLAWINAYWKNLRAIRTEVMCSYQCRNSQIERPATRHSAFEVKCSCAYSQCVANSWVAGLFFFFFCNGYMQLSLCCLLPAQGTGKSKSAPCNSCLRTIWMITFSVGHIST